MPMLEGTTKVDQPASQSAGSQDDISARTKGKLLLEGGKDEATCSYPLQVPKEEKVSLISEMEGDEKMDNSENEETGEYGKREEHVEKEEYKEDEPYEEKEEYREEEEPPISHADTFQPEHASLQTSPWQNPSVHPYFFFLLDPALFRDAREA